AADEQRILGRLITCEMGDQAPIGERDCIAIDDQQRAGATVQSDHLAAPTTGVSVAAKAS
ncbi:MAG TPA: hypothetical protein VFR48_10950, partial [Solirubrobacteraceae bacterium]|nr:hypothetical protein [Solirubrobacteraceae bacterium]